MEKYGADLKQYVCKKDPNEIFTSIKELRGVQRSVCLSSIEMIQNKITHVTKELLTNHVQKLDR